MTEIPGITGLQNVVKIMNRPNGPALADFTEKSLNKTFRDMERAIVEYDDLKARYRRAVEVVRDVEWADGGDSCPCCLMDKEDGHDEECKLVAVLAEAEGGEGE